MTVKRSSWKRHEIMALSPLLTSSLVQSGQSFAYKDGHSDETVAQAVTKKIGRTISPDDIRQFRHSSKMKLASEERTKAETIEALMKAHEALIVRLHSAEKRIEQLEREADAAKPSQPPPRQISNGHYPARPGR